MKSNIKNGTGLFLLTLGCLTGLFLILGCRIQGDSLSVAGVEISSHFDPGRMFALIFSVLRPFGFLLPFLAYLTYKELKERSFASFVFPAILFLPGLIAWTLKTQSVPWAAFLALVLICCYCWNLVLWLQFFEKKLSPPFLLACWAFAWVLGGGLSYIHAYLTDYFHVAVTFLFDGLYAVLPPVGFMEVVVPSLVPLGNYPWFEVISMGVQTLILLALIFVQSRKYKAS